jgi:rRNA maturation RNase YbeY
VKEITIYNDFNPNFSYNKEKIENILFDVLSEIDFVKIKLSIIFTNRDFLRRMKKKYFNIDQFTDVIAFNLSEEKKKLDGEIYISIDDVKENAKLFLEQFDNEFKRVVIHGALHLIGYEDSNKEEKKNMRIIEDRYLSKFNFTLTK